jgi:hypothetical protein
MKKLLTRFAKQDIAIARAYGSTIVANCLYKSQACNVTIRRNASKLDVLWLDNFMINVDEQDVIDFMVEVYQVEMVAV